MSKEEDIFESLDDKKTKLQIRKLEIENDLALERMGSNSRSLNYMTICSVYDLDEIKEEVTFWKEAMKSASTKRYSMERGEDGVPNVSEGLDKSKYRPSEAKDVVSANICEIEPILAVWMEALECKKCLDE